MHGTPRLLVVRSHDLHGHAASVPLRRGAPLPPLRCLPQRGSPVHGSARAPAAGQPARRPGAAGRHRASEGGPSPGTPSPLGRRWARAHRLGAGRPLKSPRRPLDLPFVSVGSVRRASVTRAALSYRDEVSVVRGPARPAARRRARGALIASYDTGAGIWQPRASPRLVTLRRLTSDGPWRRARWRGARSPGPDRVARSAARGRGCTDEVTPARRLSRASLHSGAAPRDGCGARTRPPPASSGPAACP